MIYGRDLLLTLPLPVRQKSPSGIQNLILQSFLLRPFLLQLLFVYPVPPEEDATEIFLGGDRASIVNDITCFFPPIPLQVAQSEPYSLFCRGLFNNTGFLGPFHSKKRLQDPLSKRLSIVSSARSVSCGSSPPPIFETRGTNFSLKRSHRNREKSVYSMFLHQNLPNKEERELQTYHRSHPPPPSPTLNRVMKIDRFQMETPSSIRKTILPDSWAISIDLQDAYLHIPIHKSSRQFFRFHLD